MSEYIVSARKYRPDSFESLVGQDNIAQSLRNSILRGRLAHAYLFCGPRGVGKTSAARIFAKTINCSNPGPDMEPCGECESCRSFKEGRSYCIHELDAASNNSVDDIRALTEQVQLPPQVGRYSVYIIDEVHMLSSSAFNAFLKTLEEPPSHAIFILATTEKHKILPTILSRCQTYDFSRISIPDIVSNLKHIASCEGVVAEDEALHVIARKADGAMRDALTIFDQTVAFCGSTIKYEDVIRNLNVLDYEYGFQLVDKFLHKDYAGALLLFDEILRKGFDELYFVSSLGSHLRNLIVSRNGALSSLLDMPESLAAKYSQQASLCSLKFLFDALQIVSQCEAGYKAATNQRLHIEFALMKLAFLGGVPSETSRSAGTDTVAAPQASSQTPPQSKAATAIPATTPATSASAAPQAAVPVAPATPAPASSAAPAAAPATRPQRAMKKGVGISLSSIMADDTPVVMPAEESSTGEAIPADDVIVGHWKQIAEMYNSLPRLKNALLSRPLEFRDEDGTRLIVFTVVNEAQKRWIELNSLRTIESEMQKRTGCRRLRLVVEVVPEEKTERKIYMPGEMASDLIEKNEQFRDTVKELGLDV